VLWALQTFGWAQFATWRALRADDPKRADVQHLNGDAFTCAAWLAAVDYQLGVIVLFYGATALARVVMGGPRALLPQGVSFAAGALVGGLLLGFHLQPHTTLATELLCYAGLMFATALVAHSTHLQNRQLLSIKRSVEAQNQRLQSLHATGIRLHRADSIDQLLEQGLGGLLAMLENVGCGLVLVDPKRPNAVRHARFEGLPAERGLAAVAARVGDPAAAADDGLMLLPLAPQLKQLDGYLIVASPVGPNAATLSLLQLFRDQIASALESGLLTLKLQRLAHTDALTGTFNRAHFTLALEQATRNKLGPANTEFSLVNIDLNGLKRVNDQHGHEAGDSLIVQVAQLLRRTLRDSDELCRVGGDEFVVVCSHCDSRQAELITARIVASQASAALELGGDDAGGPVRLPLSFSIGHASSDEMPVDQLVRAADARMYAAKQAFYRRG